MSKKQKKQLYKIIISTVLLAVAYALNSILELKWYIAAPIFIVPYIVIGFDTLKKAVKNIASGQMLDESFLMSIATVGAFFLQEYPEAVFVMLFYQVGELFESIAVGRSRRSISHLLEICPETANVLRDGVIVEIEPSLIKAGDTVVIKPGEKIPVDGVIIDGTSTLDTKALTGESMPLEVTVGDKAISGTVNLSGALYIKAEKEFNESTVSKILQLVENTASVKSKSEAFITRFSKFYTPVVVGFALVIGLVVPIFAGNWLDWLRRALIILVVSCPCALVLSVPLSFFAAIGGASRQGILVKGSEYLEKLAKAKVFAFDKTGTLTEGKFTVNSVSGEKTLYYAAAAEQLSTHPIGVSVVSAYKGTLPKIKNVTEHHGFGVEADVMGDTVLCGNKKLMEKFGVEAPESGNVIYVSVNNSFIGTVTVTDTIKESAARLISSLKAKGEKTVMLTGDGISQAKIVAEAVNIDEFKAGLLPQDKVAEVEKLIKSGVTVYTGDGINDAPVLMLADVGVSMGALGAPAAIEASDMVIVNDEPEKLFTAIKIAKKTRNIVIQNVTFSLVVKIAVLVLSTFSLVGMGAAIFADVGVLVLAVLNAMRGLRVK